MILVLTWYNLTKSISSFNNLNLSKLKSECSAEKGKRKEIKSIIICRNGKIIDSEYLQLFTRKGKCFTKIEFESIIKRLIGKHSKSKMKYGNI